MRGGRRRTWITRGGAAVWCENGRWGPRRLRTSECRLVLRAEDAYGALIGEGMNFGPGSQFKCSLRDRPGSLVQLVVTRNPIWRFGRAFFVCPRCSRRATRLYAPTATRPFRCRACWGLSYLSQMRSYRSTGVLGALLGSPYLLNTRDERLDRRLAARRRYDKRRRILQSRASTP